MSKKIGVFPKNLQKKDIPNGQNIPNIKKLHHKNDIDMLVQMIFYTSIFTTLTFQSLFTFMNCGHDFFHIFQEIVSQQSHFIEIFSSWIEYICCFK